MQNFEFITVGVDSPEQNRLARAHAARKRGSRREGTLVSKHEHGQRQRQNILRVRQRTYAPLQHPVTSTRAWSPSNGREGSRDAEVQSISYLRNISPVYGALSIAAWPFDPHSPDARYTHYCRLAIWKSPAASKNSAHSPSRLHILRTARNGSPAVTDSLGHLLQASRCLPCLSIPFCRPPRHSPRPSTPAGPQANAAAQSRDHEAPAPHDQ